LCYNGKFNKVEDINEQFKNKGKFLSLLLRHKPKKLNIKLDKFGWANVEDLIKSDEFTFDILETIVKNNDKGRMVFGLLI
jgi:putative RNA 2'-phosphotransferase